MNLLNRISLLAAAAVATLSFQSCGEGDDPTYLAGPFDEFATITSINSSTVTYDIFPRGADFAGTICSYQPDLVPESKYSAGDRVFITYMLNSAVSSPDPTVAAIQLTEIEKAYTPSVEVKPSGECSAGTEAATLTDAPYLAGDYLNMVLWYPYARSRSFGCRLDQGTVTSDSPRIYLSSESVASDKEEDADHKASFPVSINLRDVWAMVSSNKIELVVLTEKSTTPTVYTFTKK